MCSPVGFVSLNKSSNIWISNQDYQFKHEVLENLARLHHIKHQLTVAYSSWTNETAESLMRSVLAATRSMLAKLKLTPTDWCSVFPSIATALNSTSLERLGHSSDGIARITLEVLTGIFRGRPILQIIPSSPDLV